MKHFDGNKKRALLIFIAILLAGLLASCSKEAPAIVNPPVTSIRVVMDSNYPPYIFLDEQGNAHGILVDQWALWEKRTGVKVELSAIHWDDALRGMKNGDFDVIDTIFYTEERAQIYDFTDSYAQIDVPIFFHNNISGIADAEDLRGFRVAVKSGDADAAYLAGAGVTDLVYYNSYEEIIQAAERKEETIFVIDQPPGLYFLYKYGLQNQFNYSAPLFSGDFHRAVKKGDPALLALVADGFSSISESEYQAIDNRWFGIQQDNRWQEYLPYLLVVAMMGLVVISILIVFTRILQKRVGERTHELEQALADLQKSERKYREIFNATTEAIFIHAVPGGELLHVNETMLRMYGYATEEEALSESIGQLGTNAAPYSQQDAYEKMRKALEDGAQVFEWLAKRKTGELFWTEVSLRSSQIGGEGQILAVVRDITERKQAEESLRASEEKYRTVANFTYDWEAWSAPDGSYHYVSPSCERISGHTAAEFLDDANLIINITHPDDKAKVGEYIDAARRKFKEQDFQWDFRIVTPGGETRWISHNCTAVYGKGGQWLGRRESNRDITDRKQAEDEMCQRVMELETLYESGLAINQLLNPREIGQKVIELLGQKLGWHHTTIRLYHPQDESLELLAFNQPGLKNEAERREVEEYFKTLITNSSQGLSGWAVQHKQAIRSNDLRNNPHYVDTYPGLQSGLYVPMKLGDRVVGVISIESEQLNAFNANDERLSATLANQAASALENARLFEAEQKQRQVSDALRDALSAGASMSASLDFETILDRLLEALERVVPFEGGCIMLVQPEKQKINIARMRGYKKLGGQNFENIIKLGFDIASVENLRWMFENKQPLVISDVEQYPGWIRTPETSYIRSWAGAPIIVNDEVVAFFSLDSTEPNFFTNDIIELLRAFTGQASLALQNARLFDETARRAQEFASLYETSAALSAENELNALLKNIVEHVRKLLNANSGGMYLYLSETDELELKVDTTSYRPLGTRLQLNEGAAGRVAQTHQPLRIDDYSTWEGRASVYEGIPIRAVLEVPMLYGGELIGVLTAEEIGNSKRKFTEADERLLSLFASQAAGVIHSARLREQTARHLDQLQALHLIDRAISSSFDLRPILNTVITQTIAQLGVDAADVLLFHPHLQILEYVAGQGFHTRAIEQTNLRLGECFSGRAAFERRTIQVPDLPKTGSNFTRASLLAGEDFLEFYAVPLIAKGKVKGVLEVFHRSPLPRNPEWLDFLETLAGQAAISIDQTQLFDDLQRANLELIIAYDATIEGWSHAMDLRDKETENHTRRVTEMTLSLAKALGIKDSETLHIRRGALLHDIGKMGVPDNILLKEGKLTDEEWVIMRRHPTFSYEMLRPIKYLQHSLDIPYCHHEKWDGTGYPRGLKGEQIPFAARIFAVIDVWDAVTGDRPYRKGWTKQKALKYIREQSGKHFEPRIVDAFLELFGNEKK
ncbi:MAG: GAF domain-containing protein [Anaerolineales bacterium]|nr:GAF domain-containing protein [Anaerolineales bacterium]